LSERGSRRSSDRLKVSTVFNTPNDLSLVLSPDSIPRKQPDHVYIEELWNTVIYSRRSAEITRADRHIWTDTRCRWHTGRPSVTGRASRGGHDDDVAPTDWKGGLGNDVQHASTTPLPCTAAVTEGVAPAYTLPYFTAKFRTRGRNATAKTDAATTVNAIQQRRTDTDSQSVVSQSGRPHFTVLRGNSSDLPVQLEARGGYVDGTRAGAHHAQESAGGCDVVLFCFQLRITVSRAALSGRPRLAITSVYTIAVAIAGRVGVRVM